MPELPRIQTTIPRAEPVAGATIASAPVARRRAARLPATHITTRCVQFARVTTVRLSQLATLVASIGAASLAYGQASAPVQSSVFTHPVNVDDGPESGSINDNWKFITHPPAAPVVASDTSPSPGQRHGRGGGRGGQGGGHGGRGMTNASNDNAASPNAASDPGAGSNVHTGYSSGQAGPAGTSSALPLSSGASTTSGAATPGVSTP